MQIVTRTVGQRCVVGLIVAVLAVGVGGCANDEVEPVPLQQLPPEKPKDAEGQPASSERTPEEPEDTGPPTQDILVNCATVRMPIPEGWVGQQTGTGTWTFGAPGEVGELTIDGEYREGADALLDIRQLTAQLGGESADTKTYGKGGIVIIGDDVDTGTEWRLGMVVGEANQIVNLSFEYDTSAEPTDELATADADVAEMATNASIESAGTCDDL